MSKPFIVVFRPHQRPAWAEAFWCQQEFIDNWENGQYKRSCLAEKRIDEESTFGNAVDNVGHDLSSLTILYNAEDAKAYLCGNPWHPELSAVRKCAEELGWLDTPLSDVDSD